MKLEKHDVNSFFGEIDLFLCSSGFEERSTSLATTLGEKRIKTAVIFHREDTYHLSKENLEVLKRNIPQSTIVYYPDNSPLETYDKFHGLFLDEIQSRTINDKLKVVIDITTFTREVLLILMKLLNVEQFLEYLDITISYTPAESYSNSESSSWLTKGVKDIRSVLGYSGTHLPSKELMLILLSGFEEERASEIIKAFEPNKLILGKASSGDSINERLSGIASEKYKELVNSNSSILIDEFEFSCTNVKQTQAQIEALAVKYGDTYNIVVSPLNNKVSTMGVAIAGLKNESIQVCYASANQYNINAYSKKSDYFLIYSLPELIA